MTYDKTLCFEKTSEARQDTWSQLKCNSYLRLGNCIELWDWDSAPNTPKLAVYMWNRLPSSLHRQLNLDRLISSSGRWLWSVLSQLLGLRSPLGQWDTLLHLDICILDPRQSGDEYQFSQLQEQLNYKIKCVHNIQSSGGVKELDDSFPALI